MKYDNTTFIGFLQCQSVSLFMHPDQAQNTSSGIQGQEATAVAVIYVTAPTSSRKTTKYIPMLIQGVKTGASIYAQLKATEIEDRSLLQKPFEQVDSQEDIRMILKWLSERSGRLTTVQLRIKDSEHSAMYHVGFRAHKGHVYVMYVHDLPSNQLQITHVWKPSTTFANLTTEEIQASVARAQEVNRLLAAKQTYDDKLAEELTTEQWAPEVQITEVPQTTENSLEFGSPCRMAARRRHELKRNSERACARTICDELKQTVLLNSRDIHEL